MRHKTNVKRFAVFVLMAAALLLAGCSQFRVLSLQTVHAEVTETPEEPAYPRPAEDTVLQKGARGTDVSWLQSALNAAMDAGLTVDGDFGGGTEAAVIAFQEQQGLTADGVAGAETIQKLDELLSADTEVPTETEPPTEEAVEEPEHKQTKSIFLSYWRDYFLCVADYATHFIEKTLILLSFSWAMVMFGFGIIIAAFVFLALFKLGDSFQEVGRHFTARDGWVYDFKFVGSSFSIRNGMGCFLPVFLILAVIVLLLGPTFVDWMYLSVVYGTSTWGGILRALLFSVMRLVVSVLIVYPGAALMTYVVIWISFLVALPFTLIRAFFRWVFNKHKFGPPPLADAASGLYYDLKNTKSMLNIGLFISVAIVLLINSIPLLMVLEMNVPA